MKQANYAEFERVMKGLSPKMTPQEVYRNFMKVMDGEWEVKSTAALGDDGKYHLLYRTERIDDGKIYIGKHSTLNLDDGYQGSGYAIQDGKASGLKFRTTPLAFFRNYKDAYDAEKFIVNQAFIRDAGVLNTIEGGEEEGGEGSDSHAFKSQPLMVMPSNHYEVRKPQPPQRKKLGAWTFSRLRCKKGAVLNWIDDESKTCTVLDDWNVEYEGQKMNLTALGKMLNGGIQKYKNPLNAFKRDGKTLAQWRDEIKAGICPEPEVQDDIVLPDGI